MLCLLWFVSFMLKIIAQPLPVSCYHECCWLHITLIVAVHTQNPLTVNAGLQHGQGDQSAPVYLCIIATAACFCHDLSNKGFASLQVAPAMNTFMWNSPFTNEHLAKLQQLGAVVIPPISKALACGDVGTGAMAEPHHIAAQVHTTLSMSA